MTKERSFACVGLFVVVFDLCFWYNIAMTKKMLKTVVAALAVALPVSLCACSVVVDGTDVTDYTGMQYTTYDFFNTNTTVSCYLPAEDTDKLKSLWDGEIRDALDKISSLLSQDGEKSDVKAFNRAQAGATLKIDAVTYEVLSLAKQAYVDTDGAFNPALALSVDLWGFSTRFNEADYSPSQPYDREDYKTQLPDEEYVEAFLSLSDFSETEIYAEDDGYYITKSASVAEVGGVVYTQQLDLSGIGKGYAADVVAEILRKNGFVFGYVDIGASSMSLMKNARKEAGAELGKWTVSVLSPTESGKYYFKAYVKDASLATSGNYQQYYEIDDRRYSHIIDPHTGEPYLSDVLTASVFGENAALCDAYSTAFCVLGSDKAIELASELQGYTYTVAVETDQGFKVLSNADGKLV